jgi:type I restriction enzyme S subunit
MSIPPYPAYKPTGIGWLPEAPAHWQVCPAKRFMEATGGGTLIKGGCAQEAADGLFPAYSASGQDVWLDTFQHQRPGIVLSAVGARCGKTFKADGRWGVVANTNCLFPVGDAQRDFLWYVTNDERWWEIGGTAQPFVRVGDTLARIWVLPPTAEQRAIAAFLDRECGKIDALVAEQERLIALLKEKRQAVISHAVTKGLDPTAPMKDSGVAWLGQVPAHWEVKRLKQFVGGVTVGVVVMPSQYYADGGVPALRSLNVREMAVSMGSLVYFGHEANAALAKSMLRTDDLVAVRTGKPGTTAVVPPELDGANCIDLILIRRSASFVSRFLGYVMNSSVCHIQYAAGSEGALQQHFNIETAGNLQIALPPLADQSAITAFLDGAIGNLDTLTTEAERAIVLLKERRAALISAAVTGKIDVRGLVSPADAEAA